MNPRPPSPAYFRQFVRTWCGALDCADFVVFDHSDRCPHAVGAAIHVGAGWLTKQAIPRSAIETKTKGEPTT
jgi:hypothetical protein